MKLVITEEDRQFMDSIVERSDPAKLIKRQQDGVNDEDWAIFIEALRRSPSRSSTYRASDPGAEL